MKIRRSEEDEQREIEEEEQDMEESKDEQIQGLPEMSADWAEFEQWKLHPEARKKEKDYGIITKDGALTYMETDDINVSTSVQDLAFQCYKYGFEEAGKYFEFINDSDVVTRRSWKGFERKQESTVHQKKDIEISRQKRKRGLFG